MYDCELVVDADTMWEYLFFLVICAMAEARCSEMLSLGCVSTKRESQASAASFVAFWSGWMLPTSKSVVLSLRSEAACKAERVAALNAPLLISPATRVDCSLEMIRILLLRNIYFYGNIIFYFGQKE